MTSTCNDGPASNTGSPATSTAATEERSARETVRMTAGKLLRSEDLIGDEKPVAAAILRANLHFGNPHVVRCGYCHVSRTLYRDENEAPFALTPHGWRCEPCDVNAATQEVVF